jgi:hypothetical protein
LRGVADSKAGWVDVKRGPVAGCMNKPCRSLSRADSLRLRLRAPWGAPCARRPRRRSDLRVRPTPRATGSRGLRGGSISAGGWASAPAAPFAVTVGPHPEWGRR